MATNILVIGESGTGKSTSIINLNPNDTFIINVLDKPLPFKGFRKKYIPFSKENPKGNYYATDDYSKIIRIIDGINRERPEIKNIIIDDFQYLMCNEYMTTNSRGYDKFESIGKNVWGLVKYTANQREDLSVFYLSHSKVEDGKSKPKTIGKMIDNTVVLEGMFTIVLHSLIQLDNYKFLTQNDGSYMAKSPLGMFEDKYIDNDLFLVKNKINEYFND
jgi:hypothetical protein